MRALKEVYMKKESGEALEVAKDTHSWRENICLNLEKTKGIKLKEVEEAK